MYNETFKDKAGNTYLVIEESKEGYLYVSWEGKSKDDNVRNGADHILNALDKAKVSGILNDNRELQGNWSGLNDWIESDFIPKLFAKGLRYIAHIFSPHFITKFSSIDLETRNLMVEFKTFNDEDSAYGWLSSKVGAFQEK